jgi:hypothetical protein
VIATRRRPSGSITRAVAMKISARIGTRILRARPRAAARS